MTATSAAAGAPARASGIRLRRRRCLVCYWDSGSALLAHPFPDAAPVPLSAVDVDVLAAFDTWATPDQSVADAVCRLCEHGLLLAEGTDAARRDAAIARQWADWGPQAAFLHFTTQEATAPRQAPEPFTRQSGRIALPHSPVRLESGFGSVLFARRTCYRFADRPTPLSTFAGLLRTTFGPVGFIDAVRYRRTSPSAGACQPLEAYLAVTNVEWIDPGWYHYDARGHALELLAPGCTPDEVSALCCGQTHAGQAGFLVVVTAVISRAVGHNATARAYRVCLLEAGHFGQTFALTATALGIGSFQLAACDDSGLADRLGLDNISRTPVHVLGAGVPSG